MHSKYQKIFNIFTDPLYKFDIVSIETNVFNNEHYKVSVKYDATRNICELISAWEYQSNFKVKMKTTVEVCIRYVKGVDVFDCILEFKNFNLTGNIVSNTYSILKIEHMNIADVVNTTCETNYNNSANSIEL